MDIFREEHMDSDSSYPSEESSPLQPAYSPQTGFPVKQNIGENGLPIHILDANQGINQKQILLQQQRQMNSSLESFKMQMGFQPNVAPSLRIVDTEMFPYPKFWVKKNHLRPSVVLAIDNFNQVSANSLTVMVVAMDPETKKPIANARIEGAAQGIDEELSSESKKHGVLLVKFLFFLNKKVRFSELKIFGDKTVGGRQGTDILLAFCLYSKQTFPPAVLHQLICPNKIRVYNRFDELPAPNIVKAIPNRIMVGETIEVSFYGQLFKKGKGTYCGISMLGNVGHVLSPSAMDDSIPPIVNPPPQVVEVIAENHFFKLPMQSPVEGYVLFNASNDNERFGLGKFLYIQNEPSLLSPEIDFTGGNLTGNNNSFGGNWGGPQGGNNQSSGGNSDSGFFGNAYFGNMTQLGNNLENGIDVNKTDPNGNSALFWAAWKGHNHIVDFLLKKGADINYQDSFKETALHAACRKGHINVVKTLIQNGADPDIENAGGCSAFHLAASAGARDIVEFLAQKVDDLNSSDHDHLTALHYCIMTGQDKVAEVLAKLLRECGHSLNSGDTMGFTPVHWCVALKRESILRTLLENGADVNRQDIQQETPLFIAVKNSNEQFTRLLLNYGAKTDIRNNQDQLPIHLAITHSIKDLLSAKEKQKGLNQLTVIKPVNIQLPANFTPNPPSVKVTSPVLSEVEKLRIQNLQLMKKVEELTNKLGDIKPFTLSPVTIVANPTKSEDIGQIVKKQRSESVINEKNEEEEEEEDEDEDELDSWEVSIFGKGVIGEIKLPFGSNLKDARSALAEDSKYPKGYLFWFEKMQCAVEDWQEERLKVEMCGKLCLKVVDASVKSEVKSPRTSSTEMTKEPSKPLAVEDRIETEDDRALDWWLNKFSKESEIHIDQFLDAFKAGITVSKENAQIVETGVRDFFQNVSKKNQVTVVNLSVFLKLFGPLDRSADKITQAYTEKSFHGFITFDEAQDLLKGQSGAYLVRYSQSLLHKGCFVLNVNKGSGGKDVIENYVIRYNPQHEKFIFYNKPYESLRKFLSDPMYSNILRKPIETKKFIGSSSSEASTTKPFTSSTLPQAV